jgi:hypothetical protein
MMPGTAGLRPSRSCDRFWNRFCLPGGHAATAVSFGSVVPCPGSFPVAGGAGFLVTGGEAGTSKSALAWSSSPGRNRRTRPYSPSYPASLMTSPRRSRLIASVSAVPPIPARSSAGTSWRMASSGPNAATSRSMTR